MDVKACRNFIPCVLCIPWLKFIYFLPNTRKIPPFISGEHTARLAVKNAALQEIASAKVNEAKPPLLDKSVLNALAARKF